MRGLEVDLAGGQTVVAAAVSGGPDSMALCALLNGWAEGQAISVHALIVDHGLRSGSAAEAEMVAERLKMNSHVEPVILKWEGDKPKAGVQEEARKARYDLMARYCREHGIAHLFLGHHRDDQAETVLFRLAKGSGLDGLTGMQPVQNYDGHLTLLRPLLAFSKDDILATCAGVGIEYVRDPSNESAAFARVRLRQSAEILSEEGLSAKRLAVTAKRLSRARKALDSIAEKTYKETVLEIKPKRIVFKYDVLVSEPEEIVLRCLLKAIGRLRPEADYSPRMEKVEDILHDLISLKSGGGSFRKRTLGGVVFAHDEKAGAFVLSQE